MDRKRPTILAGVCAVGCYAQNRANVPVPSDIACRGGPGDFIDW